MKKQILRLGFALMLASNAYAQEDMSAVWGKKPDTQNTLDRDVGRK